MAKPEYTDVLSLNLSTSPNAQNPVSIENAGASTFRFIYIPHLLDNPPVLTIRSTTEIVQDAYACVSYPWSGLEAISAAEKESPTILPHGLVASDAVSIPMLQTVCVAAKHRGAEYLWLDKLGIRQDENLIDKEAPATDKLFQMKNMYTIYARSQVCIVAPGGLTRLPDIDEKTTWIDRAWTLQEAVAPKDVRVLFRSDLGDRVLQHNMPLRVEKITDGVGMSELKGLLQASLKSQVSILPENGEVMGDLEDLPTTRIGVFRKDSEPTYPVVGLLGALDHTDADGRLNALWRCLIMRSAKCKEDLVYSSMGIMGVTVDGKGIKEGINYSDDQVMQLLIRFVKALVAKGNRAEWLGLAPSLGPATGFSGLPPLPLDRNVGHGFIKVKVEGKSWSEVKPDFQSSETGSWWWLRDSPQATVHDNGDISIRAKAIPVEENASNAQYDGYDMQRDNPDRLIHCSSHRAWDIKRDLNQPRSFAVYVGKREYYTDGAAPAIYDPTTSLLMLVRENGSAGFQNVGYAWGDENLPDGWEERDFTIGG